MLSNPEAAAEHPDMTEDLAETLSTSIAELEYRIESELKISD
jgi:hypothetical protein